MPRGDQLTAEEGVGNTGFAERGLSPRCVTDSSGRGAATLIRPFFPARILGRRTERRHRVALAKSAFGL
jgi:hypothetical protein